MYKNNNISSKMIIKNKANKKHVNVLVAEMGIGTPVFSPYPEYRI